MLVLIFCQQVHQKLIFNGIFSCRFHQKMPNLSNEMGVKLPMKWTYLLEIPLCFHNFFWLVVIISLIYLVAKRLITRYIIIFA
jgi:hypothetical protein